MSLRGNLFAEFPLNGIQEVVGSIPISSTIPFFFTAQSVAISCGQDVWLG
jgi:hypothetical protein